MSTPSSAAASDTVAVNGPGESCDDEMGTTPTVGTCPTVGLSPTHPLKAAGQVIEPSVSVPIAKRVTPAATAAPLPDEEPPGDRLSAYGLRVSPPYALQPDVERSSRRLAHSLRLALPSTTIPASRSRATIGASSRGGGMSTNASDPAVVARPAVSMLSFTSTGTPCNGLRGRPRAASASSRVASSRASGLIVQTALISGSTASTRSRAAATSSALAVSGGVMGSILALEDSGHDLVASARRW